MESFSPNSHPVSKKETVQQRENSLIYQAVEKRACLCVSARRQHLLRCASSFVIAAYGLYASFLRIRAPCISWFLNSLSEMPFFNGPPSSRYIHNPDLFQHPVRGFRNARRSAARRFLGILRMGFPLPSLRVRPVVFRCPLLRPAGILKQNVGCPGIPRNSDSGLTGG